MKCPLCSKEIGWGFWTHMSLSHDVSSFKLPTHTGLYPCICGREFPDLRARNTHLRQNKKQCLLLYHLTCE